MSLYFGMHNPSPLQEVLFPTESSAPSVPTKRRERPAAQRQTKLAVTAVAVERIAIPDGALGAEADNQRHRDYYSHRRQSLERVQKSFAKELRHLREDKNHEEANKTLGNLRAIAEEIISINQEEADHLLPPHSNWQLVGSRLLFRGPLFGIKHAKMPRESVDAMTVGWVGDDEIKYSGQELRQSDCLVFMALVNLARNLKVGTRVLFSVQELCEALWGDYSGASRKRLKDTITRLQKAVMRFPTFQVQLVGLFEYPERGKWAISFDKHILGLFKDQHVWTELGVRRQLSTGLATWLYGYVRSQTILIPTPLRNLRNACGSTALEKTFRKMVRDAMDELVAVGVVDGGWSIKQGVLRWMRVAPVQLQHPPSVSSWPKKRPDVSRSRAE